MIGRERELAVLFDGLAKARTGVGSVAVIEGDAGIGKTTLVKQIVSVANDLGMVVLAGVGDSTDRTTAYFAWRQVFLDLLEQSDLPIRAAAARSPFPAAPAVDSPPGSPRQDDLPPRCFRSLGSPPGGHARTGSYRQSRDRTPSRTGKGRCACAFATGLAPRCRAKRSDRRGHGGHALARSDFTEFLCRVGGMSGTAHVIGTARGPDVRSDIQKRLTVVEGVQWLRPEPMNAEEKGDSSRERSAPVRRMGIWPQCSVIELAETRCSWSNCHEWRSPIDSRRQRRCTNGFDFRRHERRTG